MLGGTAAGDAIYSWWMSEGAESPEVIAVDPDGNAYLVPPGGKVQGSPDGRFVQVKDRNGNPTGIRKDGPHNPNKHKDPRSLRPHAHRPNVTIPDGTPWLPVK